MNALDFIPRAASLLATEHDDDRAWLTDRAKGIGSSDVAAVLGLSPWSTPLAVWRRKLGLDVDTAPTPSMNEGHAMEPLIAREYAEDTGATLYPVPFLRDRAHPWRCATLDRIAVFPDGRVRIVEMKWSARGLEGVPLHYRTQCLWQMDLTGIHECDLTVRTPGKRADPRPVEWDESASDTIIGAIDAFWRDYIETGVEPAGLTDDEKQGQAIARMRGRDLVARMDATGIMCAVEAELATTDRTLKIAEARAKELRTRIAEEMAVNGVKVIEFPDGSRWTYVEKTGAPQWKAYALALGGTEQGSRAYPGRGSAYVTVKHAEEE